MANRPTKTRTPSTPSFQFGGRDVIPREQGARRRPPSLPAPEAPGRTRPMGPRDYDPSRTIEPGGWTGPRFKPRPGAPFRRPRLPDWPGRVPGAGRIPGGIGRALGRLGFALDILDFIEPFIFKSKNPAYGPPWGGWRLVGECTLPLLNYNYGRAVDGQTDKTASQTCRGGQAVPGAVPWPPTVATTNRGIDQVTNNAGPGNAWRYQRQWHRDVTGPTAQAVDLPVQSLPPGGVAIGSMPNPNFMRGLPDFGSADPNIAPPAAPPGRPVYAGFEIGPPDLPPRRPVDPYRRQPPGPGTKEKKVRGPVVAFFAVMDSISEWSEVVDAAFASLPKDVQDRWSRDRRGLIDNAGQYGIDGADWKMQAVWHNWHLLDPVDFIRRLVANQIEDKLIGSLHRNLPRNMINAAGDGQAAYGELVGDFLGLIGLGD